METNSQTPTSKGSVKSGIIAILILIALIYGCNEILCNSDSTTNYTKEQQDSLKRANFVTDNQLGAYVISQQYVTDRLKSPGSADFPSDPYFESVKYIGDSVFNVNSYVDSQNGYGALMRTNYFCSVKFKGGENWELLEIKLKERE